MIKRFFTYLSYLLRHKYYVFLECCKYGIFWRGIKHDASKFLPSEFFPYMNHFGDGIQRGRDKTGYYKADDVGDPNFERAWFLHQKRNDHHWQYWVQPTDGGRIKVLEMPLDARKEMVADWRGAGRAQGTPNTLNWYKAHRHDLVLGPETRAWVEHALGFFPAVSEQKVKEV